MAREVGSLVEKVIPAEHLWKIRLLKSWDSLIGDMKAHVKIESIAESVLTLGVSHSVWAQELHFLSDMLIIKINEIVGSSKISMIRFKIVSFNNERKKTKPYNNKEHKAFPSDQKQGKIYLSAKELLTLDQIKDDVLRQSLLNYHMKRCVKN